jgi:carbamoyltransferase
LGANNHNGSACLLHGDEIVVAIQEERLTRIKRARLDYNQSFHCVEYCLQAAGIAPSDLTLVVECRCDDDPGIVLRGSRLDHALGGKTLLLEISHHLAHAFSVGPPSGFGDTTVLVIDGGGSPGSRLRGGELLTPAHGKKEVREHLSLYQYAGGKMNLIDKQMSAMPYLGSLRNAEQPAFPMSYLKPRRRVGMPKFASLGHMFSSVARQIFGEYLEAGKVMGLAPYGHPDVPIEAFLTYADDKLIFSDAVTKRYRHDRRWPDNQDAYANLAASVQRALEFALERIVERIRRLGLPPRLCYTGGVALNSVANHKVLAGAFDDIFILPAACDGGTAIGAAYYGLKQLSPVPGIRKFATDSLGRSYTSDRTERALASMPGLRDITASDPLQQTADALAEGKIVGWFTGGSEFGPRALGQRSILCDPRRQDGKALLNGRVKHREAFRPFAPAVLAEHMQDWFDVAKPTDLTSFMLEVCEFKAGVDLPAVVHVDRTGRVQTITREVTPLLHALLSHFAARTGTPLLVNTSFNVMGEPIVETPRDALWCLLYTGIDCLYLDGRVIGKAPEFRSVLEFVPLVRCTIVEQGKALDCETEFGPHRYAVTNPDVLATLAIMDGASTGYDLAARAFGAGSRAEGRMMKAIGWLMRMSAIDFAPDARGRQ